MNENRTQVPQPTTEEVLELTEQILNLTEQMNNLVDQMLNLFIPTDPEDDSLDEGWTAERFEGLVHDFLKKRSRSNGRKPSRPL